MIRIKEREKKINLTTFPLYIPYCSPICPFSASVSFCSALCFTCYLRSSYYAVKKQVDIWLIDIIICETKTSTNNVIKRRMTNG